MKKDISFTLKRADKFQVILIGEGVLVGLVAGLVVLLYRIALEYAGEWRNMVLGMAEKSPLYIAGWFVALAIMAVIVARLLKFESLISGSGIPQLKAEMINKLDTCWWKIVLAKFVGGFLCIFGGLALGREGPSIQLGAMTGKGVSKSLDRGKTEEKFLLTCGASAGLAAAFHAPLAGVMFSLEEIHKNFSVSVLLSVMTASLTADVLCSTILGVDAVFSFEVVDVLPLRYYGAIVLLGFVLGLMGAFYNWFTLKAQEIYGKAKFLGDTGKIVVPFMCAGVLGFTVPEILGSGHELIEDMTAGGMMLGTVVLIFVGRFIFSAVSFGSGAPGGIFFPLLVLGGFIGGAFATAGIQYFGMDPVYLSNFVILAMAGYFAAIVRAPLTGIVLIFEMTGSVNHMLSLSIVSITAYIVATLLRSKPIYESLMDRLLAKRGEVATTNNVREKILTNFVVSQGSRIEQKLISEVTWPDNCLLVSVQRGVDEIIPKGKTKLLAGDIIVAMTDERDSAMIQEKMEILCGERRGRFGFKKDIVEKERKQYKKGKRG